MEKFIKLCKICEIILNNERRCRCGKYHGAVAPDGLACRDCWNKYRETHIYQEMKARLAEEETHRALEEAKRIAGREDIEFAVLRPREKKILILRYGSKNKRTLDFIAKKFGVSRSRIQQIEARIFEKLHKGVDKIAP